MTCSSAVNNLAVNNSGTNKADKIENCRAVALFEHLKLLAPYLQQVGVTELVINKPNELITESSQGWQHYQGESITLEYCQRLAKLIATYSGQKLDASHPILSSTLPSGERVQIAIPPVTLIGRISITIRKPASANFTLQDYQQQGYFESVAPKAAQSDECELKQLYDNNQIAEFLQLAIERKENIIVSGATRAFKILCQPKF